MHVGILQMKADTKKKRNTPVFVLLLCPVHKNTVFTSTNTGRQNFLGSSSEFLLDQQAESKRSTLEKKHINTSLN